MFGKRGLDASAERVMVDGMCAKMVVRTCADA